MSEARAGARAAGSAVAVVLLWAHGLLTAVLAASPLFAVARATYGAHPRGDSALAEPGATALADLVLGRGALSLSAALPQAGALLVVGALLGHVPFGALLAHLEAGGRGGLARAYARAFSAFFRLTGITAASVLARVALGALGVACASWLTTSTAGRLDDRAADLAGLLALAPFALAVLAVVVASDVAYASLFTRDLSAPAALLAGLRALRRGPRAALAPAVAAYGAGLAAVGLATWIAPPLALGAPTKVLLVHQAALLARGFLRAVWLARAVDLSRDGAPPREADQAAEAALTSER